MKHCDFCGEPVEPEDYAFVGSSKLFICGNPECERDLQDAMRQVADEAREEAEDAMRQVADEAREEAEEDGYSRYMP